jgi:hypothetical protein
MWRVSFVVNQTQANPAFFKMPFHVMVSFNDATDTVFQVMNDANNQEFAFIFPKQPVNLVFDPFRNILLKQAVTIVRVKPLPERNGFKLNQNEPNPFSNNTLISYEVASERMVTISVHDSNGKMVNCLVDRIHAPGVYRFEWTNPGLSPGIYVLKMEAGNFVNSKKILLAR